jgi:hypothetical protein
LAATFCLLVSLPIRFHLSLRTIRPGRHVRITS